MQEKDLEVDYDIGVVLGNGGFGTVYAGTRRRDGKRVGFVTLPAGSSCMNYFSDRFCETYFAVNSVVCSVQKNVSVNTDFQCFLGQ